MAVVGSAVGIWRYPVKSMQGEELTAVDVTENGLLGDRAYALIETGTGKVVSAKNPRKWPGLLEFSATFSEPLRPNGVLPPVRLQLPDGTVIPSDDGGCNARISAVFRREVVIRSTPPQAPALEEYWPDIDGLPNRETVTDETISAGTPAASFFDFSAIHVLTTSTLGALARAYPAGRFDRRRFRPNILIETEEDGFPENSWVGRKIGLGDEVVFEVLIPCPRCVMTTLPQRDLALDPGILRTAARQNNVLIEPLNQKMPSVGAYAKVIRGGQVRQGDTVKLL
jgi:uncharacterized protein